MDAASPNFDAVPAIPHFDLVDFRHRVERLYDSARQGGAGEAAWAAWREDRDTLFATHSESVLDADQKVAFRGMPFYPYDSTWRSEVPVEPLDPAPVALGHSAAGTTLFEAFGTVSIERGGSPHRLTLYWLRTYGGGVFLPFRDATNGDTTYGGGRYLFDTAKGADLGMAGGKVILDFNYAYHPSCAHNDRWSCPLAPPGNRLALPVEAGEQLLR